MDGKTIEVHAGKLYVEYGLEKGLREAGAVIRRHWHMWSARVGNMSGIENI